MAISSVVERLAVNQDVPGSSPGSPGDSLNRVCKHHGLTAFWYQKATKNHRCKKCRNIAVNKRRKKLKIMGVEYLGGKCTKCGYNKCTEAMDFHHKDPSQKDFGIAASGHTYSWEKMKKELDKCVLLCSNCHRELHAKEI